jgi:hypothetical protein
MTQTHTNLSIKGIKPSHQSEKTTKVMNPRHGLRRLNSERLIKFSMLKQPSLLPNPQKQQEETKNEDFNMVDYRTGENETSDSTPDKSMVESSGDQEIFDSFWLPEDDEFHLDFRNKILQRTNSNVKDIRNKYLNRLAQEKVWLLPNQKPKTHQTWIIFDWDDTLICTTFLNPNGVANDDPVPEEYLEFLKKLQELVIKMLMTSIQHGKVYIITNAAQGWVEFSAKKYMPEVNKILDKVTIISARSKYECSYPGKSRQWKIHAFLETMKEMERSAVTNLIAIGDSTIEMDASKNLSTKFPLALLKTVKLRENPSPEELIKQLMLIHQRMENIWTSAKNLTIRLEKKDHEDHEDHEDN